MEFTHMAKSPTAATVRAPVSPAPAASAFTFEDVDELPEVRAVGRPGSDSVTMQIIRAIPAPSGGKFKTYFFPADVPAATITDPGERVKATNENVRKLVASLSGATRRVSKVPGATVNYAVRKEVKDGVAGVRVFRIEDGAPYVKPAKPAPAPAS
jgi:hypothetical protein